MRQFRIDEDYRRCETDHCMNIAEARDFYCLVCQITGRAPVLRQGLPGDVPGERPRVYEVKCMMCGRGYDVKLLLAERAQLRAAACQHCSGAVLVEEAEYGTIGSSAGSRVGYGR